MDCAYAKDQLAIKLRRCAEGEISFFFDLIENKWPGPRNKPLHRLCSLMRKMRAQAIVTEVLDSNQEITDEVEDAETRCGGSCKSEAFRLSFFRSYPPSADWHDLRPEDFLGYAVALSLKLPKEPDPRYFILESVIRPPTIFVHHRDGGILPADVSNYYPHSVHDFPTLVGTRQENIPLVVRGSFFCQQNGLTHVCAHAALRMALNSSPIVNLPAKVTNRAINDALGIDHQCDLKQPLLKGRPRRVGRYRGDAPRDSDKIWPSLYEEHGLSPRDIRTVAGKLGLKCSELDFRERADVECDAYIYPLVESRAPLILEFEGPMRNRSTHVVAVVGHTLNTDRWGPEARAGYGSFPISEYTSSAAWVCHFIANDDNLGMYVTVPTDMLRNILSPKHNPNIHAVRAYEFLPGDVASFGYLVEESAALYIRRLARGTQSTPENKWLEYLKREVLPQGSGCQFVCRTLFVPEKGRYIHHLGSICDSDGNSLSLEEKSRLGAALPDCFWLTEVSLPDLYTANKAKLGDVIMKPSGLPDEYREWDGLVFAWVPGLARWNVPGFPEHEEWSFTGHVPLFRFFEDPPALEW